MSDSPQASVWCGQGFWCVSRITCRPSLGDAMPGTTVWLHFARFGPVVNAGLYLPLDWRSTAKRCRQENLFKRRKFFNVGDSSNPDTLIFKELLQNPHWIVHFPACRGCRNSATRHSFTNQKKNSSWTIVSVFGAHKTASVFSLLLLWPLPQLLGVLPLQL